MADITPERIEAAIRDPKFSHSRQGWGCMRDVVLIYHRDLASPSGFTCAIGGDASIVDPILRAIRQTSALSPTERGSMV
jgi:hypothetical protein